MTGRLRCAIVALASATITGYLPKLPAQERQMIGAWTIEYATKALTVERVDEPSAGMAIPGGTLVSFVLRNTSERPITAFVIGENPSGIGDGKLSVIHDVDFAPEVLPSNKTYDFRFVHEPWKNPARVMRVQAVLFMDAGVDEGDAVMIEMMRFRRLGRMFESRHLLPILKEHDVSQLDDASLDTLLRSVNDGPKSADAVMSFFPELTRLRVDGRVRELSSTEAIAFLSGVRSASLFCQASLKRLRRLPVSSPSASEHTRADTLARIVRATEEETATLESYSSRDMRVKQ